MPPSARVAREEEELCARVVAHLGALRPSRPPPRVDTDAAMISLRDQIASERLEDVPPLLQQMAELQAVANQRGQTSMEPVDPKSPYFGHLRLNEKDRGVRDVLIGRATYIEPRSGIRIVDWRHAPVSQLYYRYEEGTEYEEQFGDREVEGEILVRRTVTIDDGRLERVVAPQGTYVRSQDGDWRRLALAHTELSGGAGTAVRADHVKGVLGVAQEQGLRQREDRHLQDVTALLDPRQFDLISRPDTGLVVIQGGAGSGKTTIGVHRMAYLSFQSTSRFAPERMLVVVGTPALRDYIGQLLSALDLGGVSVVTFESWARKARRRCYPWLDPPIEENTPAEASRLKTAPEVQKLLERRARELRKRGRGTPQDAMALWAEVLTDRQALEKALEGSDRLTPQGLERAWRYCSDRCPAVVEWTKDDGYEDSEGGDIRGADGALEQSDERATIDLEDEPLLLRAYQILCGPIPTRRRKAMRYEHLFVDEAQDLAPVDIAVLSGIVSGGNSITLAGDTAQRLHVDTGFRDWSEVLNGLDLEHVTVEPLRIAYRSTREVLQVAREVLGPLAEEVPPVAHRSGAPVEHHHFPNAGAAAAFLGEALRPLFVREPNATVAVLARYPEQADLMYRALQMAEVPHLTRVEDFQFTFRPGVEVTEIAQVKGLEYDYVVLIDVNATSYPEKDEARYQLHIGCTRAAHQLWVLSSGKPSPLLPQWMHDGDSAPAQDGSTQDS